MTEPRDLMAAARRILAGAAKDRDRGWHESACVSAQRAAVLATQAWLSERGQLHVSGSVSENVALHPAADPEIAEAAALLDRHRIDEGAPYGSAAGADAGEADRVVAAGRRILAFAEARLDGN